MSGPTNSKSTDVFHRFPSRELDEAIEVLGAFITSGLRDEIEALRREVETLRDLVDSNEPDDSEGGYLNQRQAAEFLGCSKSYIRNQRRMGDFPEPIKLGANNLRWGRATLSRWYEGKKTEEGRKG